MEGEPMMIGEGGHRRGDEVEGGLTRTPYAPEVWDEATGERVSRKRKRDGTVQEADRPELLVGMSGLHASSMTEPHRVNGGDTWWCECGDFLVTNTSLGEQMTRCFVCTNGQERRVAQ